MRLKPDGVLFVGDLSEGKIDVLKSIISISIPTLVILGNHDRGNDRTGDFLKYQHKLLGDKDCSWRLGQWNLPAISVIGGRPCSAGGGYYLSPEVIGAYGSVSLVESVERIVLAARSAPSSNPLIILSHSGPVGLGSDASSLCGRDWKSPSVDWGDKDLALAIDKIRKFRIPNLVVFGHMHHSLKGRNENRITFAKDIWGTYYLNAAFVPRRGKDSLGHEICHLAWVDFHKNNIKNIYHRWYDNDGNILYQENLLIEK